MPQGEAAAGSAVMSFFQWSQDCCKRSVMRLLSILSQPAFCQPEQCMPAGKAEPTRRSGYPFRGSSTRMASRCELMHFQDGPNILCCSLTRHCSHHAGQVDFFGNHRNMTITAPSLDTVIHHRFTGHFELSGNFLGIRTFTSPEFQRELACLLHEAGAPGCGARRPDVLVVNSGMHDTETAVPLFAAAMRELAQRLRELQDSGVRVLWKGNNLLPKTHGLDVISRHYVEEAGLAFVNTEAVMKHFAEELAGGCCSDGHGGEHIGAIAAFHNASVRLTVSSLVTQEVLRHVCSRHTATVE